MHANQDWRIEICSEVCSTRGAARNLGARRARGEYLGFAGATDTVVGNAVEALVASLEVSGSDFSVGRTGGTAPSARRGEQVQQLVHSRDLARVTITDFPDAITDVVIENRLFRRTFWVSAGLCFPETEEALSTQPVVRGYLRATAFDVLAQVTHHAMNRGRGLALDHMETALPGLEEWLQAQRETQAWLAHSGTPELVRIWRTHVIDDAQPLLDDAERTDDAQWKSLSQGLLEFLGDADADADAATWQSAQVEPRLKAWLAVHGRRDALVAFVEQRWFEQHGFPTEARDGVVYACLPPDQDDGQDGEVGVPDWLHQLTAAETGLVASLRRVRWLDDETLELEVFAFVSLVDLCEAAPRFSVWLVDSESGRRVGLRTEPGNDAEATRFGGHRYQNYDRGVFTATVHVGDLLDERHGRTAHSARRWTLEITLETAGVKRTGGLTHRDVQGSAAVLDRRSVGEITWGPVPGGDQHMAIVTEPAAVTPQSPRIDVAEVSRTPAIDDVVLTDDTVTIQGHWPGRPPPSWQLDLVGAALAVKADVEVGEGGHFRATATLATDRWGLGTHPLPAGPYHPRVVTGDGGQGSEVEHILMGDDLLERAPFDQVSESYRLRVRRTSRGGVVLNLGAALTDQELGPYAQNRLQRWYADTDLGVDPSAVYLHAYAGASATDSPLALHHELRRSRPDLVPYWGVASRASIVPEGAVPLLMRSREWYEVLARAAYVVTNNDLDRWFVKRKHQKVLQTFHGNPGKAMGIMQWEAKQFTPRRIEVELDRTARTWDLLLSPSPEMDQYYRREYRYDGPIHNQGYPRDDMLVGEAAGEVRRDARRRLGIRDNTKAVLYAPTWRDDLATSFGSASFVRHLDLESASETLGDDYVFLMRGHRFHTREAERGARTARLLDVTDYPEINDLILASDAAVLDYSSIRFDFALTGKPMIFLVPDLDSYTGGVRGYLYDFSGSAPGPLLASADEVVSALRDLDGVRARHAEEYRSFNQRFNYLQDGRASERVANIFFAEPTRGLGAQTRGLIT